MNKKQKIIVSVVGITIVLLTLLGLTYAYFLTRIQGNTNDKSISVTTANLELTYADGNGTITSNNIMPGTTLTDKEFTVTNNGNATVDNYAVYLEELVNELTRPDDMVYRLTCTSSKENKACKGVNETTFPKLAGIIVTNSIDVGEIQTYKLTVTYKEMNVDQSADMNKKVSARVQIYNLADIVDVTGTVTNASAGDYVEMHSNPKTSMITTDNKYLIAAVEPGTHTLYVKDKDGTVKGSKEITIKKGNTASVSGTNITVTNDSQTINADITKIDTTLTINIGETKDYIDPYSLKNLIILNSEREASGTKFIENLNSTNMVETAITENDKILSTAEDDYGTSYYFRGNPIDNYVEFAEMCWRIVRIEGDGSIKLILASELTCSTTNLTDDSGYATDGAKGVKGTKLTANYGYKIVGGEYMGSSLVGANYINDYIYSEADTTRNARTKLNEWLNRKITNENDKSLLKNDFWCLGNQINGYSYEKTGKIVGNISDLINSKTSFYFTAGNKYHVTKTPSYKCETTGVSGEKDENKVGMLTSDEVIYAGGGYNSLSNYYLNSNATVEDWWLLSIDYFSESYVHPLFVKSFGPLDNVEYVDYNMSIRPSITLKSFVTVMGGNGNLENPYKVS